MKREERKRKRWEKKTHQLSAKIEHLTALLMHLDYSYDPDAFDKIEEERVRCWNKRNNLYAKLARE